MRDPVADGFGEGKIITLKEEISEVLARLLEETPLSTDQRIASGKGRHWLTVTLFDSWQLRFWILSQGADIIVRQPAALRKEIVARIEEVMTAYGKGAK